MSERKLLNVHQQQHINVIIVLMRITKIEYVNVSSVQNIFRKCGRMVNESNVVDLQFNSI